jgi:hypothetical protein
MACKTCNDRGYYYDNETGEKCTCVCDNNTNDLSDDQELLDIIFHSQ